MHSSSLNLGFHISIIIVIVHYIKNIIYILFQVKLCFNILSQWYIKSIIFKTENGKYILHGHTADLFDLSIVFLY